MVRRLRESLTERTLATQAEHAQRWIQSWTTEPSGSEQSNDGIKEWTGDMDMDWMKTAEEAASKQPAQDTFGQTK